VTGEFLDDAEAEDRFLAGVVEDVEADQPRVEVPVFPNFPIVSHGSTPPSDPVVEGKLEFIATANIEFRYRKPISMHDDSGVGPLCHSC
jgi:hypothetical protein